MKLNRLCNILLAIVFSVIFFSCGEVEKNSFSINGSLINGRVAKTAYLYEFLPQYETIRMIDSAKVENNRFFFSGTCNERKPAFIILDKGTEGLNFFLSNNDLNIEVGLNGYSVVGTLDNCHLSKIIQKQHMAVNTRKQIQSEYSKLVADSVLTKQLEDSLSMEYARPSKELRKLILSEITASMDSDRMFSKMCLRLFSKHLTSEEVDSLTQILNVPVINAEQTIEKR